MEFGTTSYKPYTKHLVSVALCVLVFFMFTIGVLWSKLVDSHEFEQMATKHGELTKAVHSYSHINRILKEILLKSNATSAAVFRLQNIDPEFSTFGTYKVSVANIVATKDISIDVPKLTNLTASIFSPILQELVDSPSTSIETDSLDNSGLKELLKESNIATSHWIAIRNKNHELIGMLAINWTNANDMPKPYIAERDLLKYAQGVSGYLSLNNIKLDTK